MASNSEDTLVNQPALAERCDGSGPVPGQVAHVREEPGGSERVQLRTDGGPLNTARERVKTVETDVKEILRIVRRECGEPTDEGDRSTMASEAAVLGRANTTLGLDPTEIEILLRAATFCDVLLEWESDGTTWFAPMEEAPLRKVIGEENRRAEPSRELIEHCADAIQEVSD